MAADRLYWYKMQAEFTYHPKSQRLRRAGEWRAIVAFGDLIGHSVKFRTDGLITMEDVEDVGHTRAEVDTLVKAGLLDRRNGKSWTIHDFADYQELAWVTEHKREQRRRAATVRWDRQRGKK